MNKNAVVPKNIHIQMDLGSCSIQLELKVK